MNIYQTDFNQNPLIFKLIKEFKNEEAIKHLELHFDEINLKGWMDHTPLHVASDVGNFEMVKYLIQNGAKINAERTGVYKTPLCWANNYEIAMLLLENGATLDTEELYYATRQNRVKVVDLLLSSGAKINENRPQYLVCNSIECIKIYLNHNIAIDGKDDQGSNLLHKLAWIDLPDVLEFAMNNGCPWIKDLANRNPYVLAKSGGRTKVINYLLEKYPDLISNKIEILPIENHAFERIFYLNKAQITPEIYFGLTENTNLVKYKLIENKFILEKIISIDVSTIHNFTFDKNGNIVIPTADNKLLKLEQTTLKLLYTIDLQEDIDLDQILYLPLKNIYLGSTSKWEIILLNDEFKFIDIFKTNVGTIWPIINQDESLISFLSYDQESYFSLFALNEKLEIIHIDFFYKDRFNTSIGFSFNKNEFAITFPNILEYYTFENETVNTIWTLDLSNYKSEYDLCYLIFIDENTIIVGKGKKLLYIEKFTCNIIKEEKLNLLGEIRRLYYVEKSLTIITNLEIISILIPNK